MNLSTETNSTFDYHYLYGRDRYGYRRIRSCIFENPISLGNAIKTINSDKAILEDLSDFKYFAHKTLNQIKSDLSLDKNLEALKVKGMINYGQTALVFETEESDILKITSRDHFLGRKPKIFDVPIIKHLKVSPKSFCHYYLEEKIYENFSDDDISSLTKRMNKLGYKIVDKRWDQFGKTKDGRMVLIDPECARKSGIFGLFIQKFQKLKSYAKIIIR